MADGAVGSCPSPCDEPAGGNFTDRTAQPREGPLCNPPAARPRRPWVAPAGQGVLATARWERADAIGSTNASIAAKSPCPRPRRSETAGPALRGSLGRRRCIEELVDGYDVDVAGGGEVVDVEVGGMDETGGRHVVGLDGPGGDGVVVPAMRCRSPVVRMSGARRG